MEATPDWSGAARSAMAARRVGGDGLPGGWLLEGPRQSLPGAAIWPLIEARLLSAPDRHCLTGRQLRLSRGELHAAVIELAARLPAGVRGGRVGIAMARGPASVVATLAAWLIGATYVPLAVELPAARRAGMAAAAALDVILADANPQGGDAAIAGYDAAGRLDCLGATLVLHCRQAPAAHRHPAATCCYIAHTSGSTGAPKGVRVGAAALLNRLVSMAGFLDLSEDDVVLYKTPALFDVHVWELALPLVFGAGLVVYEQEAAFDLFAVAALLGEARVTIAGFTPSLLTMLLRRRSFVASSRLRCVLCGGEAWPATLARLLHETLPGVRLFNSYGPTETTIAVASWPVPADATTIELGRPQPNTLFLVETAGEGASVGGGVAGGTVRGLLRVGGVQVADGYVTDATGHSGGAERFTTLRVDGRPVRFYATGDLVELEVATGRLRFAGRQDGQVKVNGVRIELDEVEEAVLQVEAVERCVALALPSGPGGVRRLCAVVQAAPGRSVSRAALLAGCAALLPGAMVPSSFRLVAAMPLTAGGKVDRALLAEWALREDGPAPEIAPRGATLRSLDPAPGGIGAPAELVS